MARNMCLPGSDPLNGYKLQLPFPFALHDCLDKDIVKRESLRRLF